MTHLHLEIHGKVQGVGFRYFVLRRARDLRLNGRVSNRADGAVVVDAEGDPVGLRNLVELAGRGPSSASVVRVVEEWSEGPPRYTRFEITD